MNVERTLKFIKNLKKNNNKEWLAENRPKYLEVKEDFESFISKVINKLSEFDPSIASLQPKETIFRINRDIRFSEDKSPYKTNLGSSINKGGRKSFGTAGYYLHIEPGNSFLGGGIYKPDNKILNSIREGIDYDPENFDKILKESKFKTYFGTIEGDKLKNPPKGFSSDHPYIEYLKHKSFLAVHSISDEELAKADLVNFTVKAFKILIPLNDFLNKAIEQ